MTPLQTLTLFSAIFGAAGSMVLAAGTYGVEPPVGQAFWAESVAAMNPEIEARNRKRVFIQRIGLGLILFAFVLQGISAFAPA